MADYRHNGGAFKPAIGRWRRESSIWKPPTQLYTRQSSTWKPVLVSSSPPTIDNVDYDENTGTDPTFTLDVGTETSGRLLVAFVSNEEVSFNSVYATGLKFTGGDSFTEETSARATTNHTYLKHQLFWKFDSTETGDTGFTVEIAKSDWTQVVMYSILGANASPIGAIEIKETAAGTQDQEYTLTTTGGNSLILCGSHCRKNSATPASGITEDIDQNPQDDYVVWSGHREAETADDYTVGCTTDGSPLSSAGASSAVEILAA